MNWCESCQTVLANEQAEDGVCERCGNPVIQKNLSQWFFKITDFIEDFEVNGKKIMLVMNNILITTKLLLIAIIKASLLIIFLSKKYDAFIGSVTFPSNISLRNSKLAWAS